MKIKWEVVCVCGNYDEYIEDTDNIVDFNKISDTKAKCVLCGRIADIRIMKIMCEMNPNKECSGCMEC